MKKAILLIIGVLSYLGSTAQQCPRLSTPINGAIDVPVDTEIRWPSVSGIFGYVISLGTTPGGGEIVNRRSSGAKNFYVPEVGLPENTTIYVSISMFIFGEDAAVCDIEEFTTERITAEPGCTVLNKPSNGEVNVSTSGTISWDYVPRATGYILDIGSFSGGFDVVNGLDVGNVLSFRPENELVLDQSYFMRITPYNGIGMADMCSEESFVTGIPVFDCDAFTNGDTGQVYSFKPIINVPNQVVLCEDVLSTTVTTRDRASGFRWYRIASDGTETLVSENSQVDVEVSNSYRYEAYNTTVFRGSIVACTNEQYFDVVSVSAPAIQSIKVTKEQTSLEIEIVLENTKGDFEFSLDNENGPYQSSAIFTNISKAEHLVFVRERNGCGSTQQAIEQKLNASDFPNFFTPNGDGINDLWELDSSSELVSSIETISIYDRYGNFIAQLGAQNQAWDGTFNGSPVPESNYWFSATTVASQNITGYFSLKR